MYVSRDLVRETLRVLRSQIDLDERVHLPRAGRVHKAGIGDQLRKAESPRQLPVVLPLPQLVARVPMRAPPEGKRDVSGPQRVLDEQLVECDHLRSIEGRIEAVQEPIAGLGQRIDARSGSAARPTDGSGSARDEPAPAKAGKNPTGDDLTGVHPGVGTQKQELCDLSGVQLAERRNQVQQLPLARELTKQDPASRRGGSHSRYRLISPCFSAKPRCAIARRTQRPNAAKADVPCLMLRRGARRRPTVVPWKRG